MENFNFSAVLSYPRETHDVKNIYFIKTTKDLENMSLTRKKV